MYEYEISGRYEEGDETKYFYYVIRATNEREAMCIACGKILMDAENPIKLTAIHYD